MQKVTVSQSEYKKLVEGQKELRARVNALQRIIERELGEEVRPGVLRRIEKASRDIDSGKGHRFNNMKELKAFFRNL